MRFRQVAFWFISLLVVVGLPLAAYAYLTDALLRPPAVHVDPVLYGVVGAALSAMFFLVRLLHKQAKRVEQTWHPAAEELVVCHVEDGLRDCSWEERDFFEKYRTPPAQTAITRYGREESVFVVARKGHEVILWDDREEGFEISLVDSKLRVVEHWCNGYELTVAVRRWMQELLREGRRAAAPIPPPVEVLDQGSAIDAEPVDS